MLMSPSCDTKEFIVKPDASKDLLIKATTLCFLLLLNMIHPISSQIMNRAKNLSLLGEQSKHTSFVCQSSETGRWCWGHWQRSMTFALSESNGWCVCSESAPDHRCLCTFNWLFGFNLLCRDIQCTLDANSAPSLCATLSLLLSLSSSSPKCRTIATFTIPTLPSELSHFCSWMPFPAPSASLISLAEHAAQFELSNTWKHTADALIQPCEEKSIEAMGQRRWWGYLESL